MICFKHLFSLNGSIYSKLSMVTLLVYLLALFLVIVRGVYVIGFDLAKDWTMTTGLYPYNSTLDFLQFCVILLLSFLCLTCHKYRLLM